MTSALCLDMANLQRGLLPVVAAFSRLFIAGFPNLGGVTSFSPPPPSKLQSYIAWNATHLFLHRPLSRFLSDSRSTSTSASHRPHEGSGETGCSPPRSSSTRVSHA